MKRIGILFGQENTFPQAFVDRINQKAENNIKAEFVQIDKVMQGVNPGYDVIVDRISQDVPFYRALLKNAAATGTAVINNPFWWSADEKFFNNALAVQIGVPVPKTVLLPSRDMPPNTTGDSFRNLVYPLDWDAIFNYVGFPAYMKPYDGGGWRDVYKLHDPQDFFDKFQQTHQLVMMLQEEIIFDDYFRCYCVGGEHVRIMQYEPRNPHHLRYEHGKAPAQQKILDQVTDYVIRLNQYLGYDLNTVEFAIRDGIPYAIDFCNPAPDADYVSVGEENFEWIVETMANYAIHRARIHRPGQDNLTWGKFIRTAANQLHLMEEPPSNKLSTEAIPGVSENETDSENAMPSGKKTGGKGGKKASAESKNTKEKKGKSGKK